VNIFTGQNWLERPGRKPTDERRIGIVAIVSRRRNCFERNGTTSLRIG
jgi:hypothetical protein